MTDAKKTNAKSDANVDSETLAKQMAEAEDKSWSTGKKAAVAAAAVTATVVVGAGVYYATRKKETPVLEAPKETVE